MTPSRQLRKDRFLFRKRCAYCGADSNLELDTVKPYNWVPDKVWDLSDYELARLFIIDLQVLCDPCLRRKKQVWKKARKDGGAWLKPFLEANNE